MKNGWQVKLFGDVLQRTETLNPLQAPEEEFEYIDVSSISNKTFEIEETQRLRGKNAPSRARRLVKANDVLFATVRPTLRRIAVVPERLDNQVCSTGYFVLRPKEGLDHRFVFYSLLREEFIDQMGRLQKGASYPAVTDGQIRTQPFAFPQLLEQRRIVGILDEAFAGIAAAQANAEQNLQNARALFESRLHATFAQRAEGWVEKPLGEVCRFAGGSQPPKSVFSKENGAEQIRLIQIRDYKSDNHVVFIPKSLAKRFCKGDDVMIGRYGPPLFQILRGLEGAYNVALMKAIPDEKQVSRDFLFYFLKNDDIRQHVIAASSRAAGQSGLKKETIEPYPIAFPSLRVQEKVVQVILKSEYLTQRLASIYRQKLAALDELKKSLLQKAFSGQL